MNTYQTNRRTMFKMVAKVFDDHNDVWNGMSPLTVSVQALKGKIQGIDDAVQQQETPTGATDAKASARDQLEDVLFLTCRALAVLGHTSNDHDLLAATDLARSDLDRLPDDELITRANAVTGLANAHKTELATFQVTQENLQELALRLQQFSSLLLEPRSDEVTHGTTTETVGSLIRDANGILRNEIDRMVDLFSRTNPDFVADYKRARVVVDRAATHKTKTAGQAPPNPKP
jgi:hypothetical protein